jgi:hypothetical protein
VSYCCINEGDMVLRWASAKVLRRRSLSRVPLLRL